MIVVDTSAIIAILQGEPEAEVFARRLGTAGKSLASAVSYQETAMVLAGRTGGSQMWGRLDDVISRGRIEIVAHDFELARIAQGAFLTFGKGRHPAALNCGDCAAYALAKARAYRCCSRARISPGPTSPPPLRQRDAATALTTLPPRANTLSRLIR